jgi:rhodanese-related sulfurtransferase
MQVISREELREKMDRNGNVAIVEVLGSAQYEQGHLPGALNVPLGDQFDEVIQQAVADKDREVVVYCASKDCSASPKAARRMDGLGYTHVYDYEDGKADWSEAGLPLSR